MNAPAFPAEHVATQLAALEAVLRGIGRVAVAVSGGVDSLTLGYVAHKTLGPGAAMFHAVSPAVPKEATHRTRQLAGRERWNLSVIDAGEFERDEYMRNPLDRCFYCKTSLYSAIRPHTSEQIVAGTNLDDLGEYRPGLLAAKEHGVRHPMVEARIDKRGVRAIAQHLGLEALAELPASPCLSSRIETGIGIDPVVLASVHDAERLVSLALRPKTVRCRVRARAVVIELDEAALESLSEERKRDLAEQVRALFESTSSPAKPVSFAAYRVGSAFLHPIQLVR
ncbi:MAG TPA: hypothetical protein VMH32_23025 [Burkholderiales bacterium]|nr:hypothetical protein [Burkholderiales bacterium]